MSKNEKDHMPFPIGSRVKVSGLGGEYEVLGEVDKKNEVLLARGSVKMRVPAGKLSASFNPKPKGNSGRQKIGESSGSGIVCSVDLHGSSVEEAITVLESALDNALLRNAAVLEVVHGIGTGKVRDAVHRYLSGSKHVKNFALDRTNHGKTIAYL